MRMMRKTALLLALCLLLHGWSFALDSISLGGGGLQDRRFLILGDSYCSSHGLENPEEDWTHRMEAQYGMTMLNWAISGSSFAGGRRGRFPMVDRCQALPEDGALDFVLLQGGSNDWSRSIPMGDPDSRDPETFYGALNYLLDFLEDRYPSAVLVGFTPWISNEAQNYEGYTQQDYTDAMLWLFERRGLLCYDASDAGANGMYLDQRDFRAQYCLRETDWYHLNAEGHAMFTPIIAQWLESTLYQADQFYDLGTAPAALRSAAISLTDAGVLTGTSDHLFAPSQAATRADLALALYRLAGSPPASDWALTDVSAEDPVYPAACWAMEAGVFSPADSFSPNQVLTREMLSVVLLRYYQDYSGGFPDAMAGLGSYRDGSAVASYARTAMGWALASGVLTDLDGMLRPQGAVSRGQLALALEALWALV